MDHSPSGKAQVAAPSIVAIELSWLRLRRIGAAQPTASIRFDRWTHGGIKALMIEAANDDPGGYVRVHNFYAGRFVDVR